MVTILTKIKRELFKLKKINREQSKLLGVR